MKYRNGFISNSSSSSFIIGYKDKKKLKSQLAEAFKFPPSYPIKPTSFNFSEILIDRFDDTFRTLDDYLDWCESEGNDTDRYIVNLLKQDFIVSTGSVCDEGDSFEAFICDSDIHYKTDELIIEKDGGY